MERVSGGPGASLTPMEKLEEAAEPDLGAVLSTERKSEGQAHSTSALSHQVLNTDISGIQKIQKLSFSP